MPPTMELGLNEISWQQQTAPTECPFLTWAALPSCNVIKIDIRKNHKLLRKKAEKQDATSATIPSAHCLRLKQSFGGKRQPGQGCYASQRPTRQGQTSQGMCCRAHVGNFDACEKCQIPGAHVAPLRKKAHGKLDVAHRHVIRTVYRVQIWDHSI